MNRRGASGDPVTRTTERKRLPLGCPAGRIDRPAFAATFSAPQQSYRCGAQPPRWSGAPFAPSALAACGDRGRVRRSCRGRSHADAVPVAQPVGPPRQPSASPAGASPGRRRPYPRERPLPDDRLRGGVDHWPGCDLPRRPVHRQDRGHHPGPRNRRQTERHHRRRRRGLPAPEITLAFTASTRGPTASRPSSACRRPLPGSPPPTAASG